MKKLTVALSLLAVAGCALLLGCSKSKEAKAQSESSPTSNPSSAASGDSAEMRIKWPVGKKYAMRMELTQASETKIPNQPEPIKQQVNLTQDFDMTALKELGTGGSELELEFKGQTIDVSMADRKVMSFDSTQSAAQDANNPVAPLLRKMVGAHIRYLIAADGKVDKVEGVEELMNRIGFNRKSQEHAMFKQMFSEETLKQYGSFGEMMPNRVVKIGDSWSVKKETTSTIGNIAVDMKFTFKKWEQQGDRKCARIETKGDMSSASDSTTSGSSTRLENGKTTGDIWFDPDLGMIVSENVDQVMTLKVLAGGQTITPQVSQKIRITLVDVGAAR